MPRYATMPAHRMAESLQQVQADQLAIRIANGVAIARIRYGVGCRIGIHDSELGIDRNAEPQVVNRFAGSAQPGCQPDLGRTAVDQPDLEVPETVIAFESLCGDAA